MSAPYQPARDAFQYPAAGKYPQRYTRWSNTCSAKPTHLYQKCEELAGPGWVNCGQVNCGRRDKEVVGSAEALCCNESQYNVDLQSGITGGAGSGAVQPVSQPSSAPVQTVQPSQPSQAPISTTSAQSEEGDSFMWIMIVGGVCCLLIVASMAMIFIMKKKGGVGEVKI
jgi:hypothetical protein